jgi:hypothetical protein
MSSNTLLEEQAVSQFEVCKVHEKNLVSYVESLLLSQVKNINPNVKSEMISVRLHNISSLMGSSTYSYARMEISVKGHSEAWAQDVTCPMTLGAVVSTGSRGTEYDASKDEQFHRGLVSLVAYVVQTNIAVTLQCVKDFITLHDIAEDFKAHASSVNEIRLIKHAEAIKANELEQAKYDAILDTMVVGSHVYCTKSFSINKYHRVHVGMDDDGTLVGRVLKVTPKTITFNLGHNGTVVKKAKLIEQMKFNKNSFEVNIEE